MLKQVAALVLAIPKLNDAIQRAALQRELVKLDDEIKKAESSGDVRDLIKRLREYRPD